MHRLLLALILVPLLAAASPLPDFPFVYIYGIASRDVAPDKATITFRVKSYDTQADRAYRKQSEIADALLAFTAKLGLPNEDIVAQPIEKDAVRREDEKGKELEIIGYDCVRSVRIQLKDLGRFPPLIEFLYSQSNVEGISVAFESKDEAIILRDLTSDACDAARDNAARLAKGFQRKLGNIRAISESGFSGIGGAFGFRGESEAGYMASSALSKRDFRIIPSTISFHKGVYAIFAIE